MRVQTNHILELCSLIEYDLWWLLVRCTTFSLMLSQIGHTGFVVIGCVFHCFFRWLDNTMLLFCRFGRNATDLFVDDSHPISTTNHPRPIILYLLCEIYNLHVKLSYLYIYICYHIYIYICYHIYIYIYWYMKTHGPWAWAHDAPRPRAHVFSHK